MIDSEVHCRGYHREARVDGRIEIAPCENGRPRFGRRTLRLFDERAIELGQDLNRKNDFVRVYCAEQSANTLELVDVAGEKRETLCIDENVRVQRDLDKSVLVEIIATPALAEHLDGLRTQTRHECRLCRSRGLPVSLRGNDASNGFAVRGDDVATTGPDRPQDLRKAAIGVCGGDEFFHPHQGSAFHYIMRGFRFDHRHGRAGFDREQTPA
jgi:hypothetical protein